MNVSMREFLAAVTMSAVILVAVVSPKPSDLIAYWVAWTGLMVVSAVFALSISAAAPAIRIGGLGFVTFSCAYLCGACPNFADVFDYFRLFEDLPLLTYFPLFSVPYSFASKAQDETVRSIVGVFFGIVGIRIAVRIKQLSADSRRLLMVLLLSLSFVMYVIHAASCYVFFRRLSTDYLILAPMLLSSGFRMATLTMYCSVLLECLFHRPIPHWSLGFLLGGLGYLLLLGLNPFSEFEGPLVNSRFHRYKFGALPPSLLFPHGTNMMGYGFRPGLYWSPESHGIVSLSVGLIAGVGSAMLEWATRRNRQKLEA